MNDNQTEQKIATDNQGSEQKQGNQENQNKEHQHDYTNPVGDKTSPNQNQEKSESKDATGEMDKNQGSTQENNTVKNQK